ncbi:hypothetical protein POM88_008672 [Heracleum sosnowskyi]|uniref:Uncharacterized protein n=1 Tax=Heracleum sosnowskyi TaxID=360622 RepID=A0AAD8N6Q7_9APIA|nr:hypothetical protein POM88_008672 [Heracleum sosnowskyi]
MKANQQNAKKKNMSLQLVGGGAGGGALAGLILLGGALALVTTFAFKRKQHSKSEKNKHKKDSSNKSIEEVDHKSSLGQGLSFLLQDSLSPHLNDHFSSNGTEDTQDKVSTHFLLDESSDTNVGNDEEIDILEKERNNYFCDESTVNREELAVPAADSSLPLKLEEVGDSYNDWQVPLRIDGNDQELVKAAHTDDQLGLDGKTHEQGEASDGNAKTITERKEILVEGAQSNQPGTDDDSHKLEEEFEEAGEIILEKRKEPTEEAVRDHARLDQMPHMGGEECDYDAGIINEKGEELIGEVVAANGMILSEELEATTMNGDQDILCSDGTVLTENETETQTCDLKKPELLLRLIDGSSVTKPGDNDLFEERLVVEDTKILKEDEANEPAIQEDHGKVQDREQTQLVEANGDNKEYYNTYRENTNDQFEEADEISVENDQQMQSWDECQKIHINGDQEKYNSSKLLPEINAFHSNGFEVQEFSFPPLDSPSLVKPGKLHKHDSAETTLHMEVINPMEKDGLSEEVSAYQIILENKPSVQSAENDEMRIHDDGGDSAAAKGEETLKSSLEDIAQPTKLFEEEDNNDGSKEEEEAVEIIHRENLEVEHNLQTTQEEHDNNDSVDGGEYDNDNDCDDGDVEDDSDEDIENDTEEEDNVEEVEESSETTGDSSSLDSNTEAIWPDESVLEFSEKVNDMQANNLNFKEIVEKDSYVKFNSHKLKDYDGDSFMMAYSEKLSADAATLKQATRIFNMKFWFLSLLVPFLLLLWVSLSQLDYFTSFHYHFE